MKNTKLLLIFALFFIVFQNLSLAGESATFESFYIESSVAGWILSAILAILAGLAIFFTGGTASPIVLGIGSWIGGMAGLTGIAATNYGLALIGFGSLATGGLGIAGGVAILTAALTFSTEVVIDYSLTTAMNTYSHSKFIKDSKKMITLPIPQNEKGSDGYEDAVIDLKEHIDNTQPLSIESNQQVFKKILDQFEINSDNSDDRIKDYVLRCYLYFVTYDYAKAKDNAQLAINLSRTEKVRRTLPAYIYATSTLYEESFNYPQITQNYFRYAVMAEPDNELIPLMFAIYLDRMMYRMNDDANLNHKSIDMLRDIAFEIKDKDLKTQSLVIVLMRYFMRLKIEQQKILALAETENTKIKNNPKTLEIVKGALGEYKTLMHSMKPILNYLPIEKYIKENNDIEDLYVQYAKYEESTHYLEKAINELEEYQVWLKKEQERLSKLKASAKTTTVENSSSYDNLWMLIGGLILLLLVGWFIRKHISRHKN